MPGRVDVLKSRELQAAILGLRNADKETRKHVRATTRQKLEPEFTKVMAEHSAMSPQPKLSNAVLVRTARIAASDQNVKMKAAASTKRLSGGLVPNVNGKVVEMGARNPVPTKYYRKSKNGGRHVVKRNAMNQLPPYRKGGHVFFPTTKELIPRFAALWTQTAIRSVREAFDKRK